MLILEVWYHWWGIICMDLKLSINLVIYKFTTTTEFSFFNEEILDEMISIINKTKKFFFRKSIDVLTNNASFRLQSLVTSID